MTQAQPTRSISLAQLHIKEPCHVDWDAMTHAPGDESKRFCSQCEKHVHNLDALTQPEIDSLFEAHQGRLCVRYTPPAAKPVPSSIMLPRAFPRRPLLTTISRIAAAILLSSSLGLAGCGRSSAPSSGSITTIERFNDWRSTNAYSWVNSLMDPFFGSAPSYAIPTGVVVLGGGISPTPPSPPTESISGSTFLPANPPSPAKPAALGEIAAVKGKPAIKGDVYCPPPASQPALAPPSEIQPSMDAGN